MARVPRSADQRLADLPVPVLGAIGFAVVLLGVGGVLTGHTASDANPAAMPVALAAGFTPLGVFVLRRRPGHPVGRLMLAAGLVASIAALSVAWSTWVPAAWLSQWAWWPPLGAVPILLRLLRLRCHRRHATVRWVDQERRDAADVLRAFQPVRRR